MTGEDFEVAVVGAGAAGIAATRALCDLGLTCIVLEASGRVGGRAYTDTASLGSPCRMPMAYMRTVADPTGIGWARSTLHDERGPVGFGQQTLFVDGR